MISIRVYLYLALIFLITTSTLVGSKYALSDNLIYIALVILMGPVFIKNYFLLSLKKSHVIISIILISISLIASIKNLDINLFFANCVFILIFYIGFYLYNFCYRQSNRYYPELKFIAIFFSLALLYICFANYNFTTPFLGIYDNPNMMGGMLSSALIINIAVVFGIINTSVKRYYKGFTLLLIMSFLLLYFIIQTVSRASIISVLLTLFITYLIMNIHRFHNNRFKSILKYNVFLIVILLVVIYNTPVELIKPIIDKFNNKSSDLFDGRSYIWSQTFLNAGAWGQGSNYFVNTFQLGAHNSFISILGRFGYLYASVIMIAWGFLGIKSLGHVFISNKNIYLFLPITCWLGFTFLSLSEVMLYKPIMIFFFLSMCLLNNKTRSGY